MIPPRLLLIVTFVIFLTFETESSAQTTGAAFLLNDQTPQAVAMGGSGVTTSWGSAAMGANPANLGRMSTAMELYTAYASPIEGEQWGRISAAFSLKSPFTDAAGISVVAQHIGGIQGTDSSGNPTGTFGSSDLAVSAGFSGQVTEGLRYGFALKGVRETIGSFASNTAVAADMGLSCDTGFNGVLLGISANNVGQKISFVGASDNLPMTFNAGAEMPFGNLTGVATISRLVYDQQTNIGVGVSYQIGAVDLRAGYLLQTGGPSNLALQDRSGLNRGANNLAAGIGLRFNGMRLDYALNQGASDLGLSQVVSLTMAWGGPPARDKAPAVSESAPAAVSQPQPPPTAQPARPQPSGESGSNPNDWFIIMGDK